MRAHLPDVSEIPPPTPPSTWLHRVAVRVRHVCAMWRASARRALACVRACVRGLCCGVLCRAVASLRVLSCGVRARAVLWRVRGVLCRAMPFYVVLCCAVPCCAVHVCSRAVLWRARVCCAVCVPCLRMPFCGELARAVLRWACCVRAVLWRACACFHAVCVRVLCRRVRARAVPRCAVLCRAVPYCAPWRVVLWRACACSHVMCVCACAFCAVASCVIVSWRACACSAACGARVLCCGARVLSHVSCGVCVYVLSCLVRARAVLWRACCAVARECACCAVACVRML